jgi:uncharacterized ion transporter superfamily protein YfcC
MKKFPTAFTILFALIVVVAALTWIIPAGQYERAMNETLGREAPVPGTYTQVEPNPQGIGAVLMAPIGDFTTPTREWRMPSTWRSSCWSSAGSWRW